MSCLSPAENLYKTAHSQLQVLYYFPTLIYAAQKNKTLTGVQLYSVRDDMKKDPLGTLKQLAEMGYRHVEHASYTGRKFYGYSASEFKKILADLGLSMPSGHTVME